MVTWNTPYKHSLVCQEYLYMAVSYFNFYKVTVKLKVYER